MPTQHICPRWLVGIGVALLLLVALTSAIRWNLLRPDIITYTVQEGDNDGSIARRFGLDVDTLQ